jgi:hypothetical protein
MSKPKELDANVMRVYKRLDPEPAKVHCDDRSEKRAGVFCIKRCVYVIVRTWSLCQCNVLRSRQCGFAFKYLWPSVNVRACTGIFA